jgi:hypothetical protein
MAAELVSSPYEMKNLIHEGGGPRMTFMTMANDEYDKRGGKIDARHIGAVAEAILIILKGEMAL